MEQSQKLRNKLNNLKNSVNQLEDSLNIDLSKFNTIEQDAIMNGQIQKFEVCSELLWKTLQIFMRDKHGIDSVSPKTAVKEFYATKYLNDAQLETVLNIIEDRNRLSHIYNEMFFKEIHSNLNRYLTAFNDVLKLLEAGVY